MADDWRIRECTNQLLFCVAFKVREVWRGQQVEGLAFPDPLPPFTAAASSPRARSFLDQLAAQPAGKTPVRAELNSIARTIRKPEQLQRLTAAPPWSVGELVTWWLQAGRAVADWRRAGETGSESPRPSSSAAATSEDETDPERLVAWLWEAANRRLQTASGHGGEYPAVWYANHATDWRLDVESPVCEEPAGWREPCRNETDARVALLEWCADPRHQRDPVAADPAVLDAWASLLKDRYRDLAKAGERLLRQPCEFDRRLPDADTGHRWRCLLPGTSFLTARVICHPLWTRHAGHRRHVASGWLVSPVPATLLRQCQDSPPGAADRAGSFIRAVVAARRAWPEDAVSFAAAACLSPARAAGDLEGTRLAALTRLALLTHLVTRPSASASGDEEPDGLDPRTAVRVGLAVAGLQVRWTGPSGSDRLVPLGAGCGEPPESGTPRLVIEMRGSDVELDVGIAGPPASCPEDLLEAIEEFDWQCWSVRVMAGQGLPEPGAGGIAAAFAESGWESTKRDLLGIGVTDAEAIERLAVPLGWLNGLTLRLRAEPGDRGGDGGRGILELAAAVQRAIVRVATAVERTQVQQRGATAGGAGLFPPRDEHGRIDLRAWIDGLIRGDRRAGCWDVAWERSDRPFGTQLAESPGDPTGGRAAFSAGPEISDDDLGWLRAAAAGLQPPWAGLIRPLQDRLVAAIGGPSAPDVAAAIAAMRAACDGAAAEAFDRLVQHAVGGDPAAVTGVRLLHDDPRFGFTCHPPVRVDEQGVALRPVAIGDTLAWRDEDQPVDTDVELSFATDPSRGRRVLSRGRPAPLSAEAWIASLAATLQPGPPALIAAVASLNEATDRRRLFGVAVSDPLAAVVSVADLLVTDAAVDPAVAEAAFEAVRGWCAATGCRLVPGEWQAASGSPAEGLTVGRTRFHASVPAGRVVVERFGGVAADGSADGAFQGFVSAGPLPAGFAELAESAAAITGDGEEIERVRRHVEGFPKRVLDGQASAAAKALFEVVWRAVLAAPERNDLREVARAVHRLLDRSYDMLTFEPTSVSEYPEAWLRTADGGPPRGGRVNRVLRPGVRTRGNSLVWYAIVETG